MAFQIPKEYYNVRSAPERLNLRWWTVETGNYHSHMIPIVKGIEQRQQYRALQNLKHARLYENEELGGLTAALYSQVAQPKGAKNRVTLNVIASVVDTAASKIAKNKPRPLFLTERGDEKMQKKSKNLTSYIGGLYYGSKAYAKGQECFVDGSVYGTGCMKIRSEIKEKGKGDQKRKVGKIELERILVDEIIVDDLEAIYGEPRCLYQKKHMHREVVLAMDAVKANRQLEIKVRQVQAIPNYGRNSVADLIYVVEGWHLPSGDDTGDGKHVICIDNATIFEEEWKKPYFPFAFFKWKPKLMGFYGAGVVQEIVGPQIQINKILRDISEAMHLVGVPRVWIDGITQLLKPLSNDIGGIQRYQGNKPEFETPPSMAPDTYQHLKDLIQWAFELSGVSQMSATSQKPAGLNSGEALREYNDIETDRFQLVGQRYEEFFLDIARLAIDMTAEMAKDGIDMSVQAEVKRGVEKIQWKDVEIEEDELIMKCYPTALLPTEPAGRFAKVQEFIQAGWMDKANGMMQLDFPDVENWTSLETAMLELVMEFVENMIDGKKYVAPEPYYDMSIFIPYVTKAYGRAKLNGVEEDKLELLRRFIQQCLEIQQAATSATTAAESALGNAGAQPLQARPQKAPVSNLLPFPGGAQPPGAAPTAA